MPNDELLKCAVTAVNDGTAIAAPTPTNADGRVTDASNGDEFRRDSTVSDVANLDGGTVKGQIKHSRRLPYWMWFTIAKSLGIKLYPSEKPVVSTVLHACTVVSAAGTVFTNAFYSGYDITSVHTPTDILDGIVLVLMVTLYCGIGVYSHRLAYRLFVHPKFLEKVRLHSKTVMKMNAALIVFLTIALFVIVQNLALEKYLWGHVATGNGTVVQTLAKNGSNNDVPMNPCQKVQIPLEICQSFFLFQFVYSLFFLLWNALVALVLISVARTHTIDIRRFMRELGIDAHLLDRKFRRNFYNPDSRESKDSLGEYLWIDHDHIANVMKSISEKDGGSPPENRRETENCDTSARNEADHLTTATAGYHSRRPQGGAGQTDVLEADDASAAFSGTSLKLELSEGTPSPPSHTEEVLPAAPSAPRPRGAQQQAAAPMKRRGKMFGFRRLDPDDGSGEIGGSARARSPLAVGDDSGGDGETVSVLPHIMTEQEIMHKYWKLASSCRLTSLAFQRWTCCITVTILFWSSLRVIYWLSHTPTIYGVLSLVLPLLLLPLLASAYAEVNYEGIKVLQSIMPTPVRIQMFQYLYGMPIQMNVYGHRISYGTMGTVLAAILAAFASKILLQEMNEVFD